MTVQFHAIQPFKPNRPRRHLTRTSESRTYRNRKRRVGQRQYLPHGALSVMDSVFMTKKSSCLDLGEKKQTAKCPYRRSESASLERRRIPRDISKLEVDFAGYPS